MILPSRLYAILDVDCARAGGHAPVDVFDAWIAAGVRLVQLRAKTLAGGEFLALADLLAARARVARVMLIVNDRADVAQLSGADGVHVGQTDLRPADVRAVMGADAVVGLSTHSTGQIEAAVVEPISYLAIGPVFATRTKSGPVADAVGLAGVRQAAERANVAGLPVVAIGGITLAHVPDVLAAGASAVAVISDLLVGDVGDRAGRYLAAL